MKLMISLEAPRDFLCGRVSGLVRTEEPLCQASPPKSAVSENTHLCCPLKTIVLPSLQEHTKQNASAPDEYNKHFQVDSISPTEQAAALHHFRTINLLSREEREPNFKMAYCVLPGWAAFRHWEEKTVSGLSEQAGETDLLKEIRQHTSSAYWVCQDQGCFLCEEPSQQVDLWCRSSVTADEWGK